MKGRNPTADESRHMTAVNKIGCIACLNMGIETPPEYTSTHHVEGKTKPGAHFKVLPLCPAHHIQYSREGIHFNKYEWQIKHGTEAELLQQVEDILHG